MLTAPSPPELHYPANPEDIRAVLHRLPPGVTSGLASLELTPAWWWDAECGDRYPGDPDPLTGRLGLELLPGIFCTPILGRYGPDTARIWLQGYVYAEDLPDRPLWELYLRLRMLQTLCHEVAHHWDWTARRGRGRWRGDDRKRNEDYAERMTFTWTRSAVLPYLRATYPEACRALAAWFREHGGVELPLELLANDAGNPDTHPHTAAIRSVFTVEGAVQHLIEDVRAGENRTATRLGFARNLHYAEYYEEALTAIDSVLADDPEHAEAWTLTGDIRVHQERYVEARELVERVLARCPEEQDAWEVLADACAGLEDFAVAREAVLHCQGGHA